MWAEQNGRCAICSTTLREGRGGAAVDHCHRTGKVRGLLCSPCNTAIGKLREDPALFASALAYLERAR
jgi:hypothetical protein